jgi:hypothetical protein
MNRLSLLLCAVALLGVKSTCAQITIDHVEPQSDRVNFADSIRRQGQIERDAFSLARYRAERAAIRKERNYLEISAAIQGTLTSYNDSWIAVSGGDNSIAAIGTFYLDHIFTKDKFSIETKASAKFGYNRMKVERAGDDGETSSDGVWFKNQDEFWVQTAPSFKLSKSWSYGAMLKFRSQFANGYKSRTEQLEEHRKSRFMAPGYLDLSMGLTYNCASTRFPIKINIAPVALSAVFVENATIRHNGYIYGLASASKTSKYEGGSSIQIDFDKKFGKREVLRYRTTFFSFYGWITDVGQKNKYTNVSEYESQLAQWTAAGTDDIDTKPVLAIHPTVRWENTLDIKATKYLTTSLYFQLYYNRAQSYKVQTQTILSVGLSYTFQNKEKK